MKHVCIYGYQRTSKALKAKCESFAIIVNDAAGKNQK
jgi:hypothetical protein